MCRADICDEAVGKKMIGKGKSMYAVFVDLEKAYDTVCREELWEALWRDDVSGGLLRAISQCTRQVRHVRKWMGNCQNSLR